MQSQDVATSMSLVVDEKKHHPSLGFQLISQSSHINQHQPNYYQQNNKPQNTFTVQYYITNSQPNLHSYQTRNSSSNFPTEFSHQGTSSNDLKDISPIEKSSSGDLPKKLRGNSAFDLIADDNRAPDLEHLLKKFISKEKMKQQQQDQVKQHKTIQSSVHSPWWINQPQQENQQVIIKTYGQPNQRRAVSLTSLNAFQDEGINKKTSNPNVQHRLQPQPYSPYDFYIRGRSSHHHKLPENVFLFYQQAQSPVKQTPVYYSPNPPKRTVSKQEAVKMASKSLPSSPLSPGSPSTPKKSPLNEQQNFQNYHPMSPQQVQYQQNSPNPVWSPSTQPKAVVNQFNPMPSKLVYGLSDKSNANKYNQIANNRLSEQSNPVQDYPQVSSRQNVWSPSSSGCSTPDPESAPAVMITTPVREKKVKKTAKKSSKETEKIKPEEEGLLMQLTDDEKVQFILQNQAHKNRPAKSSSRQKNGQVNQTTKMSLDDTHLLNNNGNQVQNREGSQGNLLQSQNAVFSSNENLKRKQPDYQLNYNGIQQHQRSLSFESLFNNKNLIDFKSYDGPQLIDYSSPFDFAKTRFINSFILSGQKNLDPFKTTPTQTLVTEAKNKFEKPIPKNLSIPASQSNESLLELRSPGSAPRVRKSSTSSSSSQLNQSVSKARNPVKPFLSRGSVAERVLLFEKCPEVRSDRKPVYSDAQLSKDSRSSSKSSILYRHWRKGVRILDNLHNDFKVTRSL